MGTVVSIHVVERDPRGPGHTECVTRVARAFDWMREVEQRCTRFDPASEVMQLAATQLAPLEQFTVDAGGDLYLGGHNADDRPWSVGIRHPREDGALIETLRVSNAAVCTSGDYDQARPDTEGEHQEHHILDPR